MKTKLFFTTLFIYLSLLNVSAQTETRIFGDYNNDGKLTVEDVTHLVNMVIGQETPQVVIGGVIVDEVRINSINFTETSQSLPINTYKTLTYNISPENATNKKVEWLTSDPSIVSVDNGVIYGVSIGSATIRIESQDGSEVYAICQISVEEVSDPFVGHDYVDLGIKDNDGNTIYWATCNIGAQKPEDYGYYYSWGETNTKTAYNLSTYKLCEGSDTKLKKYVVSLFRGEIDNLKVLEREDDAAAVNWGGCWRMPTKEECELLGENSTWKWETYNNVNGFRVTGNNGNSIFLPAAGRMTNDKVESTPFYGNYWTSNLGDPSNHAYFMGFGPSDPYGTIDDGNTAYRYIGRTIRPVLTITTKGQ